jgi:hypothetical protein
MTDKSEKTYTLQLTRSELTTIAAAIAIGVHVTLEPMGIITNPDVIVRAMMTIANNTDQSISIVEKFRAVLGGET